MKPLKDKIRQMVRESYAGVAQPCECRCCSDSLDLANILDLGKKLDYTNDELAIGLGDTNLGIRCGNP
jgi:arsenite methyltransferase